MATAAIPDAIPTSLVGSYAQPDWLIDRERLRDRFPPRVRATELWRVDPQLPGAGAGRRDAARHPRPGAGRARHHHGRRGPPRELLEPLRDRARRRRRRQPGVGARPQRPPEPGAARRRPGRAPPPGAGARRRVPAGPHEPADQDHRARARSRCRSRRRTTTTRATPSWRWRTPGGARRDRRPLRRRRRHRADRRAVHAGASGGGPRVRPRRARPRARRRRTARPRSTSASATPRSSTSGRRRTRSCPSSPARRRPDLDRDRAVEPRHVDAARRCPASGSSSACIDLDDPTVETPETVADRIRRALPYKRRRPSSWRAGLRHEVPAARRRLREARGARRGGGPGPALRASSYAKRLTKASAVSATSRQPLSIVERVAAALDLHDLGHARVALLLACRTRWRSPTARCGRARRR